MAVAMKGKLYSDLDIERAELHTAIVGKDLIIYVVHPSR